MSLTSLQAARMHHTSLGLNTSTATVPLYRPALSGWLPVWSSGRPKQKWGPLRPPARTLLVGRERRIQLMLGGSGGWPRRSGSCARAVSTLSIQPRRRAAQQAVVHTADQDVVDLAAAPPWRPTDRGREYHDRGRGAAL
jgi:hypothetical protein